MKKEVSLSIEGRQTYEDQAPEIIELVTDGTMEFRDGGWDISYEETELTGMAGVTTTFRVEPGRVVLDRKGALNSQMIFEEGIPHQSLYQMAFGTLMLTVKATFVYYDIVSDGGTIDLSYNIDIENTEAGVIDYHLDIRAKD
jgi:uncharacterized beta-barrel protein YwiB (DUF1934 family)